jgi:aminoglycoside 3-N-acetyltransferase
MSIRSLIRNTARQLLRTQDVGNELRRRRLALKKRIYRRPFSLADTRDLFTQLGIERGRVIWLQSSWNEFYNLPAKPLEVLSILLDMIGPTGTLVMPAFPLGQDPARILEIDYAPSSTGLLTEIFRRQRGVLRSVHLTSSVCALGPAADFLVRDHHHDPFPWGTRSPFYRLMESDARAVCLGLGPFVMNLTPLHTVECLLYDELPFFRQVFDGTISYQWRRASGESGKHEFHRRVGRIKLGGYGRHFARDSYVERRLSNLECFAVDAKSAVNQAVALARRGITIYVEPKPRRQLFIRAPSQGSPNRNRDESQ